MRNLFIALAAMATLGLATSSAWADTGAVTPTKTLDATVQPAVLSANSAQGQLQDVRWPRYWGYRGYYPYHSYRPYYHGGYYRPYYGGYYPYHSYRPYYYGGYYRPYYGGYRWY